MELVPFNGAWCDSGTKLDLKALYRRDTPSGTTYMALPVRRHNDWQKKGLIYITLASAEDVVAVRGGLKAEGRDLNKIAAAYDHMGHFKMADYLAEQGAGQANRLADLQTQVDKFGAEVVVEMMRTTQPGFTLPAGIKVKPKGKAQEVTA